VAGEINIGCAALGRATLCAYCSRGIVTHCLRRKVLGIVEHDGAFAEYLALPLGNLHAIPEGVDDAQAVFVEPLAAACEILQQVRVADYAEAAVLGDGKLAQLIARVLQSAGTRVTMFGRHAEKLALAKRAGARTVRMARRAAGDESSALPSRRFLRRFTLVVEAAGSPSGFALAQQLTAPRGTLVLKSTFHGAASVETWPIVVHELTLIGSRCGPFARAVDLLQHARAGAAMDLSPMITRVFPLSKAPEAMRFASRRGILKVLLTP
jgi:alcohol dehydrogenase